MRHFMGISLPFFRRHLTIDDLVLHNHFTSFFYVTKYLSTLSQMPETFFFFSFVICEKCLIGKNN